MTPPVVLHVPVNVRRTPQIGWLPSAAAATRMALSHRGSGPRLREASPDEAEVRPLLIQEPVPTGASRRTPARGVAVGVRRLGDISLVDVHGPLPAVAGPAGEAVLAEWVESPAAVICDLSDVRGPADSPAVFRLALLGAHVRQWPGIPIGLICPDRDLREGLTRAAEGRHLDIAETGSAGWGELSAGAATATVRATLAPEPRSARTARDFVAQTCSEW